jgi:hypothetical protein
VKVKAESATIGLPTASKFCIGIASALNKEHFDTEIGKVKNKIIHDTPNRMIGVLLQTRGFLSDLTSGLET